MLCAVLGAALVAAPGAVAKRKTKKADTEAPVITHTPPAQHDGAGPLIIEAAIVDDGGVFDPALLVRAPGGSFERVPLKPVEGKPDSYAAEVPAALLAADLEYLIEAYDENGNGPARAGDEATPLRVPRVLAGTTTTTTVTPLPPDHPPADKKPPDESNDAVLWGTGIAVGAVIVLGAAAGIGLGVAALLSGPPATVAVTITGGSPIAAVAP
ncbi:MAG: hypothetical protein HYS27_14370 [Deltaproteobacteria bacterium]|nr:hypothetical protein [Deltaproteobacteria bacterium]